MIEFTEAPDLTMDEFTSSDSPLRGSMVRGVIYHPPVHVLRAGVWDPPLVTISTGVINHPRLYRIRTGVINHPRLYRVNQGVNFHSPVDESIEI